MPTFVFTVKITPLSETEIQEVSASDFVAAVETLAACHPGIHIVKLEGICTQSPAFA